MNGLLFLLPFILVASVGVYQDSFAVEQVTGYDYFDVTNPDGTHTWSSHEPYIFDGNVWVPFIQSGNSIQTDLATVTLNTDGSYTWNGKFIDRIIAKYSDVSDQVNWTYPNSLNNKTPSISWNGSAFVSSKIQSGIGQLDYKYVLLNGIWKTQLEATNLSSLNTKVFGFDQIVDLNSDTIRFGGVTRNLDNFNNTTFDKEFLDANKAKVLDLLNGVNFDFDLGYENLYSVTILDTGINKSRLIFDYRTSDILHPGQTLIIDPTYGYTVGTSGGEQSVGCSTGASATAGYNGANSGTCYIQYSYYDITTIPNSATITNVNIRYDITAKAGTGTNCNWKSIEGNITTMTAQQIFDDARDGTTFVSNSSQCNAIANDYVIDLTATGDADLQAELGVDDEWAVGSYGATESGTNYVGFGTMELEVTYTLVDNPDAVTDLGLFIAATETTIGLNWTAPYAGGGGQSIIGYQINVTTPQTSNPLVFLNDTGTTTTNYNVTGLTWDTDYSARVSAWTNNTGDHPLNNATGNVYDFTTTYTEYSTPPTLTKVFPDGYTSTTQLNLEWTAGSMDNINGYRIAREAPVGGGFSNIVSNTTTTTAYYNNTGLSTNTYYNYKIYAMNGTGISTASNTYVMTTYHLPDAVTDLIAEATDLITVILSWTQPTLYGTLDGYQINYTTPYGDPQTIITNSTESSDIEYEITGLSGGEQYSFRVAPVTFHGTNATGNIANATAFQNFELGEIAFPTGENPDELFEITFENYEHNSTATDVQVVYDSSVDLICDFSFVNGNTNQTYSGLTENAISGSSVYSNFTLQNPNNEIIDIYCYDSLDELNNARHRLTNTVYSDIPIINQILGFQSGDYGTTGMFGAIDLITLLIVIISIIGFNRVNPAVGVIFMFMMLGIMAWFELIVVPTAILGIIILIITLAIASVKKA